jgi:hypothetical protein
MPAQSKAQQRFMGMVHAAQKGETPASPEVAKVAKDMDKSDAKDFASTSHKGLPNHVKSEILNRLKKEYAFMLPNHNVKPAAPAQSLDDLEGVDEESEGLWANIRAKRARGEKPSPKNSKAYKDAVKAGKEINKNESVNPEEINASIIPAALKVRFERALELIQGKELSYNQKIKLLAMVIDSLGVDKAELSKISSKIKTNLD